MLMVSFPLSGAVDERVLVDAEKIASVTPGVGLFGCRGCTLTFLGSRMPHEVFVSMTVREVDAAIEEAVAARGERFRERLMGR